MTWNFDLTTAPRGKQEGRSFTADWLWLATSAGEVIRSHWIPERGRDGGRWLGLNKGSEPVAWIPFEKPEHPFASEARLAAYTDALAPARSELSALVGPVPGAEFLINDAGGD